MTGRPAGWCFHHGEEHEPEDWDDWCRALGDVDHDQGGTLPGRSTVGKDTVFARQHQKFRRAWRQAERDERRRRAGWWKRWTVCWWKHRTRRAGPGTYVSTSCWACTRPGQP